MQRQHAFAQLPSVADPWMTADDGGVASGAGPHRTSPDAPSPPVGSRRLLASLFAAMYDSSEADQASPPSTAAPTEAIPDSERPPDKGGGSSPRSESSHPPSRPRCSSLLAPLVPALVVAARRGEPAPFVGHSIPSSSAAPERAVSALSDGEAAGCGKYSHGADGRSYSNGSGRRPCMELTRSNAPAQAPRHGQRPWSAVRPIDLTAAACAVGSGQAAQERAE